MELMNPKKLTPLPPFLTREWGFEKNLTCLPPFPTREWGFKSLFPCRREVWREIFMSLQIVS